MSQERNIIITNIALYNLKKKSVKRRIELATIKGVTCSMITEEFVVHGNDVEYDYHYVSNNRKKLVSCISSAYEIQKKSEMLLCLMDSKSLRTVVTLQKEKKKNITFSRMPTVGLTTVKIWLADKPKPEVRNFRINTIISKRTGIREVSLKDFVVLKVIGRGSFGKVCLVEFSRTNELFAMKSLKKDVLIDQEQIENTLLEKNILETLEHEFLVNLVFCFQTEDRLYFVMPFMRGGELFQHLRKFRFFDEDKY